ncbi:hypothetical protein AHMF7605_26145 [Adhaeribacter arboris]|uniref:KilA-N domain-containing protein n=1 Tax=Adhaeribacter arboris TaxID=2072846 RepID=A0A2T2YMJ3_9BACT|nr:KilA-N domain-containing protein [Adhaeribacter arboris]PSR56727.1 hypothetical protein AHMF7605_26145 [Adhaeribacter arboris]
MEFGIQIFRYDGQEIAFDMTTKNLMVNATEMAKAFHKLPADFLRLDQTKTFIEICLKYGNSPNIMVAKEEDMVISKQKSGTWMHRILALKFAAWLNPEFELWVYSTIDEILFGSYRQIEESLKESAQRKNRIEEIRKSLQSSPEYQELERLELEERQANYRRSKGHKNQLELFRINTL